MTTLYKLTTKDYKTRKGKYNECTWGKGVSHSGTGHGGLCGPGYIHAYTHPLLAVFLNPLHAGIEDPVLWECGGEVARSDRGLKVGCVTLKTVKRIPLPRVTIKQRTAFAILCAKYVCRNRKWVRWANAWLRGDDRSKASAIAAAKFAPSYPAALASRCAACLRATGVGWRRPVFGYAAHAAYYSAFSGAVDCASGVSPQINLIKLAKKAMKVAP